MHLWFLIKTWRLLSLAPFICGWLLTCVHGQLEWMIFYAIGNQELLHVLGSICEPEQIFTSSQLLSSPWCVYPADLVELCFWCARWFWLDLEGEGQCSCSSALCLEVEQELLADTRSIATTAMSCELGVCLVPRGAWKYRACVVWLLFSKGGVDAAAYSNWHSCTILSYFRWCLMPCDRRKRDISCGKSLRQLIQTLVNWRSLLRPARSSQTAFFSWDLPRPDRIKINSDRASDQTSRRGGVGSQLTMSQGLSKVEVFQEGWAHCSRVGVYWSACGD